MIRESRRYHRLEFDRRAWCEHQNLTLYLPVSNVSLGGMFLQTTTSFEPGDALKVSFHDCDGGERIVAQVEIVWVRKAGRSSGVGVRVLRFLEGGEAYHRLVESLGRSDARLGA